MSKGATNKRTYPWSTTVKNKTVTFRLMERKDRDAAQKFAKELPSKDLLFLTSDITDNTELDQWVNDIENNRTITVLAEDGNELLGFGSLSYNQLHWTSHLGEINLVVGPNSRGLGLGKLLVNEIFVLAQELGLGKLVAYMVADQKGAVQVFEHLGFKPEALLADHVIDRNEVTHDLVVMTYHVAGFSE